MSVWSVNLLVHFLSDLENFVAKLFILHMRMHARLLFSQIFRMLSFANVSDTKFVNRHKMSVFC